ncbi:tyrosine--tRNA ligase [Sulfurospirillum barnesii]|uniref:Tyrosine--tRNA ligase n=1 Tax=Sulfurospirillum barnesii (strain ATCC 700032 / DSM 10660 / SES-3) TaxID=760154 RepID=I3XX91_SULBS|nr:tyrosine--tRNA ligase [Sulfurospirillum barnesii]AFL68565.1 tyrosyl-tRNA synthetase [Sulfurospirillum barnesii SES-3]
MTLLPHEQLRIIKKGVNTLIGEEELLLKLQKSYDTKQPLTIKLGLDPSAPDIHLGHAVVLRKIKQMQDLGHHVVIIIGDFTGKIGDPTGKSKGRVALSEEQVRMNAQTYCEQIFKILDTSKTKVCFNSQWLTKLTFEEIIKLASTTTIARILERDDFQKRYQNQVPIGLHEFFYPLMQAFDSVELKADIELGGTDQTFNILMGRSLQKALGLEAQIALFMPLLEGLDGIEKMSKSLGNYIGVNEAPEVMFKKIMEVPDKLILKYFELATDEHPATIDEIKDALEQGVNPRDIKYKLAQIIVSLYHSKQSLDEAQMYYDTAFSRKAIPENIPTLILNNEQKSLAEIIPELIAIKLLHSKSDFIRLLAQGGVSINGVKLDEKELDHKIKSNDVLKLGKKRFVRMV